MKITDVQVIDLSVPLKKTFKTAMRTVEKINDVVVKVYTDNGMVGYGEASPNAYVTGETKGSIISSILDYIKPNILGMEIENIDGIMLKINNSLIKNSSAKSAVDIAIYDLYGKYLNRPLYKIFGGYRGEIETDITISVNEVEEMVSDSLDAINSGYDTLKVKLGLDPQKDIRRISEIRKAVGKNVTLRVDANQGWKPKEAIKIIHKMEDLGLDIELVEQPVHYQDIEGMVYVTKNVLTPILADESVFDPKDAIEVIQKRAADLINIKLMKTGGLHNALKICTIAEIYGVECMVGCTMESKISISAAAHLAAAKSIITKVDLDAHNLCKIDPIEGGIIFNESKITMTDYPGLGFYDINF